jgi:putative nucleotidyltransferase with HDIG domain
MLIESAERSRLAAPSPSRELAILRAEHKRELLARRDLERRAEEAERLEGAQRHDLTQLDRLRRQLSSPGGAVVTTISALLGARDRSTSAHSRAVAECAVQIGDQLGLAGAERESLHVAALLHDVGKIAVPDALLQKAGPLTDEEWREMRQHPAIAQRLLRRLPLPTDAVGAIRHHHERFDGRGYPDGLSAEQIPLAARIIAVADAYQAMTSDRPYRARMSLAQARAEIRHCAGGHFCPRVVDAFLTVSARAGFGTSAAA